MTTIGLDLAKNVFHLVDCDRNGKEVKHKVLTRGKLTAWAPGGVVYIASTTVNATE